MKKKEAQELAIDRSRIVMEHIAQILSDNLQVHAKMDFTHAQIDNQNMCVLNIDVPERNFIRYINLGITYDHHFILNEQILKDVLENFLDSNTIGFSYYYYKHTILGDRFYGFNAFNTNGSVIEINLPANEKSIEQYNNRLQEINDTLKDTPKKSI